METKEEKKPEQIIVTDANIWNSLARGNSIFLHTAAALELLRTMQCEVRERCELLENDESVRQLAVYGLVQDYESGDILVLRRNKGGGEQRLYGKKYIGVGGHVNFEDAGSEGMLGFTLRSAMRRELFEEVGIQNTQTLFQGWIVGNAGSVEKVHLGAFFHIFTDKKLVNLATSEAHLHDAKWTPMNDVVKELATGGKEALWEYESWTQIVFKDYFNIAL